MQQETIYYAVRQCDMNGDKYKWSNAKDALASDTPESTYGSLSPIEAAKIWKKHSPLVVTFCFQLCDAKPLFGGNNIYYFEQRGFGWCALLNKSYNELKSGGANLIPLSDDVLKNALANKIKNKIEEKESALSTKATAVVSSAATAALSAKDIAGNTIATAANAARDVGSAAAMGVGSAVLTIKSRFQNRVIPTSGGGSPHPYDFTTLARNNGNKNNYYVYA